MSAQSDYWSTDQFEDIVTRAIIALYETNIHRSDLGRQWSQIQREHLGAVRRQGIFVPSPELQYYPQAMPFLPIPESGCVSIIPPGGHVANVGDFQTYLNILYFARLKTGFPKDLIRTNISGGKLYELVKLMPLNTNEPMRAVRSIVILRPDGEFVFCHDKLGNTMKDPERFYLRELGAIGCGMYAEQDRWRRQWVIGTRTEDSNVSVGAYPEVIKSVLYARSLPVTATGRKRPILHLVRAHKRRVKEGVDIDIARYLRGVSEVIMHDTKYTITPPAAMTSEFTEEEMKAIWEERARFIPEGGFKQSELSRSGWNERAQ